MSELLTFYVLSLHTEEPKREEQPEPERPVPMPRSQSPRNEAQAPIPKPRGQSPKNIPPPEESYNEPAPERPQPPSQAQPRPTPMAGAVPVLTGDISQVQRVRVRPKSLSEGIPNDVMNEVNGEIPGDRPILKAKSTAALTEYSRTETSTFKARPPPVAPKPKTAPKPAKDVVLTRNENEGFGFVIMSSVNKTGSVIGKLKIVLFK